MKSTKVHFGNKIRVRACGLCFKNEAILLVKHNIDNEILWAPPGGGINFGETIEYTLRREFKEETGLEVKPGKFLFLTEFINAPLHAIELFYKIDKFSGKIAIGKDPELPDRAIILDIGFFNKQQLNQIPQNHLHSILNNCNNPIELLDRQEQLK